MRRKLLQGLVLALALTPAMAWAQPDPAPARQPSFLERCAKVLADASRNVRRAAGLGGDPAPVAATAPDPSSELRKFLEAHPELPRNEEILNWVTKDVVLGARMDVVGYDRLTRYGIGAVLSLQGEAEDDVAKLRERGIDYRRISVTDYTAPSQEQLREAVAWIDAEIAAGRRVYVHCRGGIGRSANVVAAWLMRANGWDDARAWEFLTARRPIVKQTDSQRAGLRAWSESETIRRAALRERARERVLARRTTAELDRTRARTEGRSEARTGMSGILERRVVEARARDRDRPR